MAKTNKKKLSNGANNRFPVVAIGASAGGLDAFKRFIRKIPADTEMAFVLIQHLDPQYETALTAILQKETSLKIIDLADDVQLKEGYIHVVPSSKIMMVKDGILTTGTKVGNAHPLYTIDLLFTALAEVYQSYCVGILLSGMGSDGTLGLKKIKDYGGVTFVQLPKTAAYPDMPQHALDAGVVDFKIEPDDIAAHLQKIASTLKMLPVINEVPVQSEEEGHFKNILSLLLIRKNVDFTYYKQSTIRRRILRRMIVNKIDSPGEYVTYLEHNTAEQDLLYQDILIPVTSFFRDSAIFESLCSKIFPGIFENHPAHSPVRIWVAGCSTGEEAYSIAMCLHEFLGEHFSTSKLQLFATDISEKAIQKARTGMYSKRELEGVSPKRLELYFTKTDGHYQVKKHIRDLCVFAVHNFLKDPPFARMDLITCRNVLIYMVGYLQKKALSVFHYALTEKGVLLLGKSETANNVAELFKVVGKPEKLYAKKSIAGKQVRLLPERSERASRAPRHEIQLKQARQLDYEKNADDILLSNYIPAGVIVNDQSEIVQVKGSTGQFLEAAPGKASLNILKMAREGLSFEIRNALHKAKETRETVTKKDIPLTGSKKMVSIEVVPLLQTIEPYYLVLFKEGAPVINITEVSSADGNKKGASESARIQQLEKTLAQLREDMRTITEDQEAANEELQSANEELLSGSEELQSMNEELETSKEELQSTNEELMTVNQELYERKEQYNQARLYSESIVSTIREPLVVMNMDLRIKSANRSFYNFFGFNAEQIIGKILFELNENQWNIEALRTPLLNLQTGQLPQHEWEVGFPAGNKDEKNILLNAQLIQPETGDEMILLAFQDITLQRKEILRLRASAAAISSELNLMENFFFQAPALFCILRGPQHVFEFANPRYLQVSGGKELKGKTFVETFPELLNEGYLQILDDVYRTGVSFFGNGMKATNYPGKEKSEVYIDLSCQAFNNAEGKVEGILFFSYEVTEQVLARRKVEQNAARLEQTVLERTAMLSATNQELEKSNKNLQEFASIASHDLQEPLRKIQTFINILNNKHQTEFSGEAATLLGKVGIASGRMSSLIKDVLNYSKISRLAYGFVPVNLNDTLDEVISNFDIRIKEKKALITVHNTLPVIEAIPTQVKQLFDNLLGNALKFSAPHRSTAIDIFCTRLTTDEVNAHGGLGANRNYWQILFKDNGIGFEQQFKEQMFVIFGRLNNWQEYEGNGIGLAVCNTIIKNHGGLITAEGEEGEGAAFIIILPQNQ